MDIPFIAACTIAGIALVCFIITVFGLIHMLWTWIDEYADRLEWEAWKKSHRESLFHGPEAPIYWCKYNKNRKTAK